MLSLMRKHAGAMVPAPHHQPRDDDQLRRDRWAVAIVVAVMIVMFGLIIWLASLGGGVEYDGTDYWHLMP